ncbi:hypothetical protein ABFS83_04G197300 [Erythranthe nasuta]
MEKSLDSELWHACAGGMVQMPPVNSKVFYFPQGHAEHTLTTVDFGALPKIPPMILCRVIAVKFLADAETDEVHAKIRLIPVGKNEHGFDDNGRDLGIAGSAASGEKPTSFAKTLTQSDANNGGGFSVPRFCAETIFPPLDYTADPPVQNVIAKDVHGETWKFRHIYRGTPRRHLLTTGWSTFVNQKKLVAGDSIVFLRSENGDLCVGIRRAKRGGSGGGQDSSSSSGWNSGGAGNFGFSPFLKEDEIHRGVCNGNLREKGKIRPESVVEATFMAANGQAFEVVYYPRASTPEFCVKASSVNSAMRVQWFSGMRFKMPFETEDSSRISWFMGTIANVQVVDPLRWPNSPWRMLQVTWDEPDLLQNVKCVSPWLVEMVSNMPIHLSPFSPPRKKLRLPHHTDFQLDGQFQMPSFSGNPLGPSSPLCCLSDNILTAGIQGARHAQIGVPFSDLHLSNNKLHMGLFPPSFMHLDSRPRIPHSTNVGSGNENISCLLSMGNSSQKSDKSDGPKKPRFVLFGQPILTEQQMSSELSSKVGQGKNSLDLSSAQFLRKPGYHSSEIGLDTGHCKVFLDSEDVGRTLDLSFLGSYEEFFNRLGHMFGIESSEIMSHVFYRDATGALKQAGDEPFSEFKKTARRLTILMKPSNNGAERKLITGLPTAERGLDSSNQTGPLSIYA